MKALNVTDIQRDFVPGGSLAVPRGDEIIPVVNALMPHFPLVVATKDWHPADHGSFATNHPGKQPGDMIELGGVPQILWPPHCVQHSHGAEYANGLDTSRIECILYKGTDPDIDSYSGFFDNGHRKSTGLHEYLQTQGVTDLYLVGLATDYCVLYTALDARHLGYHTVVITDGCRGLDIPPGNIERAYQQMREAGAVLMESAEVIRELTNS
ncbi:MAG: bifunctional nicotinamidase/pyrazinamidase [Armatimonadota bacterium]